MITLPEPEKKSKKDRWIFKGSLMLLAALYIFFGLSQATGLGPLGRTPSIIYECVENGKTSTVRLDPNKDGTTTVTDLATGKKQRLNLTQYTNGATLKPICQDRLEPDNIKIFGGLLMVLMSISFIYMAFVKDFKRYRLRRVIAVAARET